MRYGFIYPASLLLLLTVSPAHSALWERQQTMEMMTERVSVTTSNDGAEMNDRRQRQLERGAHHGREFDIESLPPPAAGPNVGNRYRHDDWSQIQTNRRRQLEHGMK